jgi:hypothetical protein
MALKDWKRAHGYADIGWVNSIRGIEIGIFRDVEDIFGKWTFTSQKRGRMLLIKNFKTKSQALKFAKSYMRKH